METARSRILLILLLLLTTATLTACSNAKDEGKGGGEKQPVLVSTAPVIHKNIPLTIQAMGNAESCHSVAIKSRVDGEILKAHIVDGQAVQVGTPLFDLDDRPFKYRLTQLKANLERDLALLENARAKERRQVTLSKEKIGSEEVLTSLIASRQAAESTVAADRAAVAEGEMQLAFTHIFAPITGMAGRILIQPGNLVKANDTNPLVSINQLDPICISLTIAEQHLSQVQENHTKAPLTLQVYPNRESEPITATLLSLDNTIDRQTATIRLKAQASNPQHRLWPGMFVTLSLKLLDRPNALVIPTQAIQTGPKGPFVYLVKPDKTVEIRFLTIAQEDKDEAVITQGLAADETIVTVGQWRLKPGATVETSQPPAGEKK